MVKIIRMKMAILNEFADKFEKWKEYWDKHVWSQAEKTTPPQKKTNKQDKEKQKEKSNNS